MTRWSLALSNNDAWGPIPDVLRWIGIGAFALLSVSAAVEDFRRGVLAERVGDALLLVGVVLYTFSLFTKGFSVPRMVRGVLIGYLVAYLLHKLGMVGEGDLKYLLSLFMVLPQNPLEAGASVPSILLPTSLVYPFPITIMVNSLLLAATYSVAMRAKSSLSQRSILAALLAFFGLLAFPPFLIVLAPILSRTNRIEIPFIPFALAGATLSVALGGCWRGLL